jgi:hypothetical protein
MAIGRYDARDGEECRAQVEANFAAIAREMAAHGNYHGIVSTWNRWRGPALEECAQMDQAERTRRMQKVHARLEAAIGTLSSGSQVRDEEVRWLADEHAAIAAYPHSPWRDAHVALYAEFQRYSAALTASPAQCAGIERALKSARVEHDAAVDALLRHEPEWRVHDQVRQAAISEMQFQKFQAQRAGCAMR